MIFWPLDVRSSSFGRCCCAKGLWLSLCNIDWSGVHFLVVSLPTVLLNCETWHLCDCVTPNVAAFAQPSRTTLAASGRFRVVVSSRNGAITMFLGLDLVLYIVGYYLHCICHII